MGPYHATSYYQPWGWTHTLGEQDQFLETRRAPAASAWFKKPALPWYWTHSVKVSIIMLNYLLAFAQLHNQASR